MKDKELNWKPDQTRPVGKGGSKQHFVASADGDELMIETTPWGEGNLEINGE